MVASNELKLHYFGETAHIIFELVWELHKELGINFEFVNLVFHLLFIFYCCTDYFYFSIEGGGVGIPYRPNTERIHFSDLSAVIYNNYLFSPSYYYFP